MAGDDDNANADFDPGEYEVPELGPAIKEIEDVDELEAILEKENAGEDRAAAKQIIESRIEKFAGDGEEDGEGIDPTEMSPAEMGNALRDVDDVERLEELLEMEEAGEDRGSVKRLIQNRIDSVGGSEEREEEADLPPEEKYPDLDHPTEDKQYVESVDDGEYRDMWVYCETQQGELIDVSKEMLGKARELMDGYNGDYDEDERVVAILIGDDASEHVEDVIAYGADVVLYQEDEHLSRFLHKPYTEIYAAMARDDDDWRDYDE
ncbi:MAG TPA: electron transfer flavoprotein subunit alpha/FixB family protein, partial [Natrialbaceae archaeon]|nr:electron transfer flavoprotein subunit alpha/FixB family protein [Natrialbaceae archaeon]